MACVSSKKNIFSLGAKLEHPIAEIRIRAAQNILFKLQEGLVSEVKWNEDNDVQLLVHRVLTTGRKDELSQPCLQILHELVKYPHMIRILKDCNAIPFLQQANNETKSPALQQLCDETLKILHFSHSAADRHRQVISHQNHTHLLTSPSSHGDPSALRIDNPRNRATGATGDSENLRSGWKFPVVQLVASDEQHIFEFEVRFRLRSKAQDLVAMCHIFQDSLLRDFPAELFLQRPAILEQLLHLAQLPLVLNSALPIVADDASLGHEFGVCYFDYEAQNTIEDTKTCQWIWIAALASIEKLMLGLRDSVATCMNPMLVSYPSTIEDNTKTSSYPCLTSSPDKIASEYLRWSMTGAAMRCLCILLPLLRSRHHPQHHILSVLHVIADVMVEQKVCFDQCEGEARVARRTEVLELFDELLSGTDRLAKLNTAADSGLIIRLFLKVVRALEISGNRTWNEDYLPPCLREQLVKWLFLATHQSNQVRQDVECVKTRLRRFLIREHPTTKMRLEQLETLVVSLKRCLGQQQSQPLPTLHDAVLLLPMLNVLPRQKRLLLIDAVVATVMTHLEASKDSKHDEIGQLFAFFVRAAVASKTTVCEQFFSAVAEAISTSPFTSQLSLVILSLPDTFQGLLLLLSIEKASMKESEQSKCSAVLLRVVENADVVLDKEKALALRASLPLLQHLAYMDAQEAHEPQKRLQALLSRLANRIELHLSKAERTVFISRCLFHHETRIQRAAVTGIDSLWGEEYVEKVEGSQRAFDWMIGVSDTSALRDKLLERPLPESPPRSNGDVHSKRSVRSLLTKIRKLLQVFQPSSSSSSGSIRACVEESALKELLLLTEELTHEETNALVETETISLITDVTLEIVAGTMGVCGSASESSPLRLVRLALEILRNLLFASDDLRQRSRQDEQMLSVLVVQTSPFADDASVQAQLYYIFLLLSCSMDATVSLRHLDTRCTELLELEVTKTTVPYFFRQTFGTYYDLWPRLRISTTDVFLRGNKPLMSTSQCSDWKWLCAVLENEANDDGMENIDSSKGVEHILQALGDAKTPSQFLNWLYELFFLAMSGFEKVESTEVISKWEEIEERFLVETPRSASDRLVVSSIVSFESKMVHRMPQGHSLRLLVLFRRHLVPLLRSERLDAAQEKLCFASLRLVLSLLESPVWELALALAHDTDLIEILINFVSSSSLSGKYLAARVLFSFLKAPSGVRFTFSQSDRLDAALVNLLSMRRVPGSFRHSSIFKTAVACIYHLRKMNVQQSPIGAASITTAGAWSSRWSWYIRVVFDCFSQTRALGYQILGLALCESQRQGQDQTDTLSSCTDLMRPFQLALDASNDSTESDATRGAAQDVVLTAMLINIEPVQEVLSHLFPKGAGGFVRQLFTCVVTVSREQNKVQLNYHLTLIRLVRVLAQKESEQSPDLRQWDVMRHVEEALSDPEMLAALEEMVSLKGHQRAFSRSSASTSPLRLQLKGCCSLQCYWSRNLSTLAKEIVKETLLLLLWVSSQASALFSRLTLETPFIYDLMELLCDLGSVEQPADCECGIEKLSCEQDPRLLAAAAHCLCLALASSSCHPAVEPMQHLMAALVYHSSSSASTECQVAICRVVVQIFELQTASISTWKPVFHGSEGLQLCINVFERVKSEMERDESFKKRLDSIVCMQRALRTLLECSRECQDHLLAHDALRFCMNHIRRHLHALRLSGGLPREHKGSAYRKSQYNIQMCRLAVEILSSLLYENSRAQSQAKLEKLSSFLLDHWNLFLLVSVHDSGLLEAVLLLLANYIYAHDSCKASLVTSCTSTSTRLTANTTSSTASPSGSLLALISHLGLSAPQKGTAAHRLESRILSLHVVKAAALNSECLMATIRDGMLAKMLLCARRQLQEQTRGTATERTTQLSVVLLGVLANIASSPEGRKAICVLKGVRELFEDILTLTKAEKEYGDDPHVADLGEMGALFLRNMSFLDLSKSQFYAWEDVLELMLERLSAENPNPRVECYLSCALWSILYDNQKVLTMMRRQSHLSGFFQKATERWPASGSGGDTAEHLEMCRKLLSRE